MHNRWWINLHHGSKFFTFHFSLFTFFRIFVAEFESKRYLYACNFQTTRLTRVADVRYEVDE